MSQTPELCTCQTLFHMNQTLQSVQATHYLTWARHRNSVQATHYFTLTRHCNLYRPHTISHEPDTAICTDHTLFHMNQTLQSVQATHYFTWTRHWNLYRSHYFTLTRHWNLYRPHTISHEPDTGTLYRPDTISHQPDTATCIKSW
jgi:hypothetical protein